jgi:hypothetical protein
MFELKPLSANGIGPALDKAERYRLLDEPWEAQSICSDVLVVEPGNQRALVILILALTDQFRHEADVHIEEPRALLSRLVSPYERAYYGGILCERWAKALLARGSPGAGAIAYGWLHEAMQRFEQAETLRPPGNDDAILRWNACVRALMRHESLRPPADAKEPEMGLE